LLSSSAPAALYTLSLHDALPISVLRQRVGTAKLQVEAANGNLAALCELVVKKNRITSVTVTVVERPPRCQCRTSGSTDRAANRTDRKSTRLNSSHRTISYAVFCL